MRVSHRVAVRVVVAMGACGALAACGHRSGPSAIIAISSIQPATGQAGMATEVRIRGMGFRSGATVSFGAAAASHVTVLDDTTIVATTPMAAGGRETVVVRNPGGEAAVLRGGFEFLALLAAQAVSVSPQVGMPGWEVKVTGSGFTRGVVVSFGGIDATETVFLSRHELRAVVPPRAPGLVDVAVRNPGASSAATIAAAYTIHVFTLTADASSVGPDEFVTLSWNAPLTLPDDLDWVGLFAVGAASVKSSTIWWVPVNHTTGTVEVTAPKSPGQYEFRYISGDRPHVIVPLVVKEVEK